MTDTGRPQKFTLSMLCSGKLKKIAEKEENADYHQWKRLIVILVNIYTAINMFCYSKNYV